MKTQYPLPSMEHFETDAYYEGLDSQERRILGKTTRQLVLAYNESRGAALAYLSALTPTQRETLQKFITLIDARGQLPNAVVHLFREHGFSIPRRFMLGGVR